MPEGRGRTPIATRTGRGRANGGLGTRGGKAFRIGRKPRARASSAAEDRRSPARGHPRGILSSPPHARSSNGRARDHSPFWGGDRDGQHLSSMPIRSVSPLRCQRVDQPTSRGHETMRWRAAGYLGARGGGTLERTPLPPSPILILDPHISQRATLIKAPPGYQRSLTGILDDILTTRSAGPHFGNSRCSEEHVGRWLSKAHCRRWMRRL